MLVKVSILKNSLSFSGQIEFFLLLFIEDESDNCVCTANTVVLNLYCQDYIRLRSVINRIVIDIDDAENKNTDEAIESRVNFGRRRLQSSGHRPEYDRTQCPTISRSIANRIVIDADRKLIRQHRRPAVLTS